MPMTRVDGVGVMTTTKHDAWFGRPAGYARVAGEDDAPPDDGPYVPGPYDIGGTMPRAVVVIETVLSDDQGHMLWRLGAWGEDAGDTLHEDSAELRRQAEDDYGEDLGAWSPFPPDVTGYDDVHRFLRERGHLAGPGDS